MRAIRFPTVIFWIALPAGAPCQTGGRDLYIAKCSACHAPDGSGTGTIGRTLKLDDIRPAIRTSTDPQLRKVVMDGSGRMPANKKFDEDQLRGLTLFLRDLADGNPKAGRAAAEEQSRPLTDVQEVFRSKCSACHGRDGAGRTTIGRNESIPDLTAAIKRRSDEELRSFIASGAGGMPGYRKLFNATQIAQLVSYLHQLAAPSQPARNRAAPTAQAGGAGRPKATEPTHQLYVAKCAACHSRDGSGGGTVGRNLRIASLTSLPVQARSDQELAATIANGAGKMPAYKEQFNADQIHHLVAYIRDLAGKAGR